MYSIEYCPFVELISNTNVFEKHWINSTKIFKDVVNKLCSILESTKINYVKPNSAWYIFINFDNYKDKLIKLNIFSGSDLSKYLIDTIGFISVPSESFNINGLNLRLSIVDFKVNENNQIDMKNIVNGLNELINFLNKLK